MYEIKFQKKALEESKRGGSGSLQEQRWMLFTLTPEDTRAEFLTITKLTCSQPTLNNGFHCGSEGRGKIGNILLHFVSAIDLEVE